MKPLLDKIKGVLPAKRREKMPARRKLTLGDHTCTNCGAGLYGKYCAVCGQRHFTGKNPYWEMVEDMTDHLISPESKLWRTFAHLLLMPGIMTRNYFKGKRASYTPPIRLYLISLVAFFAALALLDVAVFKLSMVASESVFTERDRAQALADIDERIAEATEQDQNPRLIGVLKGIRAGIEARPVTGETGLLSVAGSNFRYVPNLQMFAPLEGKQETEVTEEMVGDFFEITAPVQGAGVLSDFFRRVQNGFVRAAEDPRKLNNSLNIWLPRVMVVFVPLFGLFLRFFYWGRQHFILNQMVFSLHFHTALFFFLTFFLIAQSIFGSTAEAVGMTLSTYGFPVFLFLSLKNAFGDGWLKTFLKFAVISVFYAFGFSIMVATVFLWGLAEV
ncbi:MAG: DUF3667 domain-containing protein [Proteobacteria bacterium]|nr:DUF3667 domain-containing protein [Pseudomonadota bacterium]